MSIEIGTTIYKKYREPKDTPCYEKIKTTYTLNLEESKVTYGNDKFVNIIENRFVLDGVTYSIIEDGDKGNIKLVDGENIEVALNNKKQFVINKYSLIKNDEGISQCYDESGNLFERAIYNTIDKEKLFTFISLLSIALCALFLVG